MMSLTESEATGVEAGLGIEVGRDIWVVLESGIGF